MRCVIITRVKTISKTVLSDALGCQKEMWVVMVVKNDHMLELQLKVELKNNMK